MNDYFASIVKYVEDHKSSYDLAEIDVVSVKDMIKKSAQNIFDAKTYDSFRRFVDALAKKEINSISSQNIYRLCYALKLNSLESTNEFLVKYLGVNPISPRVLEEFIMISGFKLNLPWERVNEITLAAENTLRSIPPSPTVLVDGDTRRMAEDIDDIIFEESDLLEYISLHDTYFAITRNTQYMAFFNYVDWENYDPKQDVTDFILESWDDETIESRYLSTFNFENEDEPECKDPSVGDHLTFDDIKVLSEVFPNIFLSYDTYRLLMQRKRRESISSETMLIVLLNDVSPEKVDFDYSTDGWEYALYQNHCYLDFTDEAEFKETMNTFLENAGCAHLNENIGFDKLILDALHDTIVENPGASSPEIKSLLFAKLRSVFKQIAAEYKGK